jgi:hypothetical protein
MYSLDGIQNPILDQLRDIKRGVLRISSRYVFLFLCWLRLLAS